MSGYFLNERDKQLVDDVIRRVLGSRTEPRRPLGPDGYNTAPESYIARIPAEGIAGRAAVGTGTGTGGADNTVVSSAVCDIYKIISGQLSPAGFSKQVYNLSLSAIEEGYAPVARDKFGRWVAGGVGGGGSCGEPRNEVWLIQILGEVVGTAATFDISLTINAVTESITIAYDATAAEVEDAFETHSEVSNGDATCTEGPFPSAAVVVEFTGSLANLPIDEPAPEYANLGGASAFISRWRPGYAG